jgi:hypothetical protein
LIAWEAVRSTVLMFSSLNSERRYHQAPTTMDASRGWRL